MLNLQANTSFFKSKPSEVFVSVQGLQCFLFAWYFQYLKPAVGPRVRITALFTALFGVAGVAVPIAVAKSTALLRF